MSSQPPGIPPEEPRPIEQKEDEGPVVSLPKWVGTALALVLIAMAALAIYTGVRYRGGAIDNNLITRSQRHAPLRNAESGGAPGEPEPGASRVMQGDGGEIVPQPRPTVTSGPNISIKGTGKDILPSRRLLARRAIRFEVMPADALVYVNDVQIGPASQFASVDEAYDLPEEGSFTVRLVAPGYREVEFIVNTDPNAKDEVALIATKLQK